MVAVAKALITTVCRNESIWLSMNQSRAKLSTHRLAQPTRIPWLIRRTRSDGTSFAGTALPTAAALMTKICTITQSNPRMPA